MQYDVVVVGAGIQGAGVAQAAAAAGYSVLVLEQSSVAAGTSSKSSKLIHGGLRYLESFQLSLVRESLQERALLLELAPDLVKRVPMHIPVYRGASRSPTLIATGLWLYRALAGFGEDSEFSRLHRSQWAALDGIRTDGLQAVYRYMEAQTDDAALTRAVLRSAQSLDAELVMPAQLIGAECQDHRCVVRYREGDKEQEITAGVLVNCAGPWVNQVIERVTPALVPPKVDLVQGSHLLLPASLKHHFYLESPEDKRAVFALPWQGQLLLGTTETVHTDAPEQARCLDSERDYLLSILAHYFPGLAVPPESVKGFAGLRVLPKSDGSAFGRSREVLFHADNEAKPRVLSVMGGKLTTYRATAQDVIKRLRPSLPDRRALANTARLPLKPVS